MLKHEQHKSQHLLLKQPQQHAQHASGVTTAAVYGRHAGNVTRKMIRQHADIDAMVGEAA